MTETKTVSIKAEIPASLIEQVESLVEAGWYRNRDEVLSDALRRFLESHRLELMEQYIREDVEWGLEDTVRMEKREIHHDLDALAGTWSDEDASEFLKATTDFDQVDEHVWQ